jgi:hypothetical protein
VFTTARVVVFALKKTACMTVFWTGMAEAARGMGAVERYEALGRGEVKVI